MDALDHIIHNNVCFNSASDSIDSGDGITIPCDGYNGNLNLSTPLKNASN